MIIIMGKPGEVLDAKAILKKLAENYDESMYVLDDSTRVKLDVSELMNSLKVPEIPFYAKPKREYQRPPKSIRPTRPNINYKTR